MGLSSQWAKVVLTEFVKHMEWKSDEQTPDLKKKKTRLWLWKDVGLGAKLQKILRAGRNQLMQRLHATTGESYRV